MGERAILLHQGTEERASAHATGAPDSIADLDALARLMDSAFTVPGLGVRFGVDAVIGLVPGIGDAAGAVVSLYILHRAQRLGLSRATLMRMTMNVAIDFVVGTVPLLGDAFDVYWKANRRNVELLRRHATATTIEAQRLRRTDWAVIAGAAVVLLAGVAASLAITIYLAAWALTAFRHVMG